MIFGNRIDLAGVKRAVAGFSGATSYQYTRNGNNAPNRRYNNNDDDTL